MIKPYYSEDGITIYHGDCLDILPQLEKVDLVLTDPDYNAKDIGPKHRTYESGKMQLSEEDYNKFCHNWFKKTINKCKNLIFTPGIANTHRYPAPSWQLCWHKPASVSFNRFGGYNAWEPIFIYGNGKGIRFGQDYLLVNTLNFSKGPEKDHPCPKPIELIAKIINAGKWNTILDPFMGSGTTLKAAKIYNRKAIGIEIEEKYCEIAVKRLDQHELFNTPL